MDAIAVRQPPHRQVRCNARQLLYAAERLLARGSWLEASYKLRDALRVYLQSECEYHACLPSQQRPPGSRVLARSLKRAGHCSEPTYSCVNSLIGVCDKSARLTVVTPSTIANAIELAHCFLDGSPYLVETTKGVSR